MKTFKTIAILLSLAIFSKGYSQGEANLIPFPNGVQIFFFETNKSELKRSYSDNAEAMDAVATLFSQPDIYNRIGAIQITAASSPSGRMSTNERLSNERAQALYDYLVQTYPQINVELITKKTLGVDENEFRQVVEINDFPGKPAVQALLSNNLDVSTLIQRLRALPPNVVEYLRANIYTRVQYSQVRILQKPEEPPPPPVVNTLNGLYLRTNVLELAGLTPSLGVEYRLSDKLGIMVNGAWAGWDFGKDKTRINEDGEVIIGSDGKPVKVWDSKAWKWWHVSPQVRYYLGSKFQMYVGVEGTIGEFNFQKTQGKFFGGGITGGYLFRLTEKLYLDTGVGLGAMSFNTIETYFPDEYAKNGLHLRKQREKDVLWFGPTNVFVSLSYKLF
jgi:hypothetical protein